MEWRARVCKKLSRRFRHTRVPCGPYATPVRIRVRVWAKRYSPDLMAGAVCLLDAVQFSIQAVFIERLLYLAEFVHRC